MPEAVKGLEKALKRSRSVKSAAGRVRFTEEEIRVTVHPASIAVDAFYHYRNPFPFPVR